MRASLSLPACPPSALSLLKRHSVADLMEKLLNVQVRCVYAGSHTDAAVRAGAPDYRAKNTKDRGAKKMRRKRSRGQPRALTRTRAGTRTCAQPNFVPREYWIFRCCWARAVLGLTPATYCQAIFLLATPASSPSHSRHQSIHHFRKIYFSHTHFSLTD